MAAIPKYKKLFSLFRSNVETGVNLGDQVTPRRCFFFMRITNIFSSRFTTFLWFSERMAVSFAWVRLSGGSRDLLHVQKKSLHPPTAVIKSNPRGVKKSHRTCQNVKKYPSSCPPPPAAVRRSCQSPLAAVTETLRSSCS